MRSCVLLLSLLLAFGQGAVAQSPAVEPDVIYVPTPQPVVDKMLTMAGISSRDVLYDLGSGDGRIVITAAKRYGARGVGIDIDPERIAESNENAKRAAVTSKVRFIEGDLFETDLRPATAVTLYLLESLNLRLRPKLLNELRPGTPVVSHEFTMGSWEPDEIAMVDGSRIFLWRIPADVDGEWEMTFKDDEGEWVLRVKIEQYFQKITGAAMANGERAYAVTGRLDGANIALQLTPTGDEVETLRLRGRTASGLMNGTINGDEEGSRVGSWSARRITLTAQERARAQGTN